MLVFDKLLVFNTCLMRAFYADHFVLPLPAGHRFPMAKYSLLREKVAAMPDVQLEQAPAATDRHILLAHDVAYVQSVIQGTLSAQAQREIGFPWSEAMVERSRRSVGATLAACDAALVDGVGVNLAGGTHHAYRYKGSGFCVFNDAAIAARAIQRKHHQALKVAIIDLDVHQGNGTASILAQDTSIFTFSMHGEHNFPFRKEASDLDIGLPDGTTDHAYLTALDQGLDALSNRFKPDFLIYLAGADAHEGDRLGRLKISAQGMRQRDQKVFEFAQSFHIGVAVAMAGGYGHDITQTVSIHAQTVQTARQFVWSKQPTAPMDTF